ncbi:hypothetical protein ARMGADRAFT_46662 [Armillaria gallica]|uniref:Uncharacterized protein n=1 Tax=Armillaria gallica TaxID=47427 RepID=A0A2H3E9Z2_ARMGA|nr:hypothetical protein ARMGADRAFT_46662 [Armillaria gallica]
MGSEDRVILYVTGGEPVDNILHGIDRGAITRSCDGVFRNSNYKDLLSVSQVVCDGQQELIVQSKRTTDSLARIHETRSLGSRRVTIKGNAETTEREVILLIITIDCGRENLFLMQTRGAGRDRYLFLPWRSLFDCSTRENTTVIAWSRYARTLR